MKENLEVATWRAKELKPGRMGVDMKVTLRTGRKMGKALSNGPPTSSILEVGDRANNME